MPYPVNHPPAGCCMGACPAWRWCIEVCEFGNGKSQPWSGTTIEPSRISILEWFSQFKIFLLDSAPLHHHYHHHISSWFAWTRTRGCNSFTSSSSLVQAVVLLLADPNASSAPKKVLVWKKIATLRKSTTHPGLFMWVVPSHPPSVWSVKRLHVHLTQLVCSDSLLTKIFGNPQVKINKVLLSQRVVGGQL